MAGDDLRRSARPAACAVGEHDEVVADALELGDDVRRENDRHAVSTTASITAFRNSRRASGSSEATGSSSSSSSRPLGERQRQRDLRLLAAGKLADLLLERKAETLDPRGGQLLVPARVELAPERERLADVKPRCSGWSCATNPSRGSTLLRSRRGERPNTLDVAASSARRVRSRGAGASSCRRRSGRRAPSPIRRDLERAVAQRPASSRTACRARRANRDGVVLMRPSRPPRPHRVGEERGDRLVVEACRAGAPDPTLERSAAP